MQPKDGLLADDSIAVTVHHESVGRMAPRHWRDAVPSCLRAGDPPVPVVVIQAERINCAIRIPCLSRGRSRGRWHSCSMPLADDSIAVRIRHEAVGGMASRHWRNAVPSCLCTSDPTVPIVVVQAERINCAPGMPCLSRGRFPGRRHRCSMSLTDDSIAVCIHHEAVGGMASRHWRDAVPSCLRAGDPPIPIVVIQTKCTYWVIGTPFLLRIRRFDDRNSSSIGKHHFGGRTARQHLLKRCRLSLVDRKTILKLDGNDPASKPATVPWRQPLPGVVAAFASVSAAVHLRSGEGQVQQILGKASTGCRFGRAKPAVMRLGCGDDVFYIGLKSTRKVAPSIWSVNATTH